MTKSPLRQIAPSPYWALQRWMDGHGHGQGYGPSASSKGGLGAAAQCLAAEALRQSLREAADLHTPAVVALVSRPRPLLWSPSGGTVSRLVAPWLAPPAACT